MYEKRFYVSDFKYTQTNMGYRSYDLKKFFLIYTQFAVF